jgi:hypothetical protein
MFTLGEVAFQCFDRVSCECGRDNAAWEDRTSNIKHKHRLPNLLGENGRANIDPSQTWWIAVETYSSLNITVKGDRLPAVAGLAEYLHRTRPDERYLTGLWTGTFVQDLLWAVVDVTDSSQAKTPVTKVPSWSWASGPQSRTVAGCVKDLDTLAEIRELEYHYAIDNPYGVVTGSRLVLRGRLWVFSALHRRQISTWIISALMVFKFKNTFLLDSGIPKREWTFATRLYLLEIAKTQTVDGQIGRTYYLILKCTSKSNNSYARVGRFVAKQDALSEAHRRKWERLGKENICIIE